MNLDRGRHVIFLNAQSPIHSAGDDVGPFVVAPHEDGVHVVDVVGETEVGDWPTSFG